jgi:hypothetical protein
MRPTPMWRLITAAAILLILVGLGALLWITLGSGEEHEAEGAEPAAGAGAPGMLAITINDFLYSPASPLEAEDTSNVIPDPRDRSPGGASRVNADASGALVANLHAVASAKPAARS